MSVLSVGRCTLDHIGVVEGFVKPGSKAEMSTFSVQGGGCAATAVAVLTRWGVATKFIGKVGDDTRGNVIESTLADEGVDTANMVREAGAVSQFRFMVVDSKSGRKKTIQTRGSVSQIGADEIDDAVVDGVDLLLVDGRQKAAQLRLMQLAKQRNIPVVFEAKRTTHDAAELVAHSDFLIASERFASQFTGIGRLDGLCAELLECGPSQVAVTMGDEGVAGMDARDGQLIRRPAVDVDVVDTTGAGDVFLGAVAYGLLHGRGFAELVEFANKAAAVSCTQIGGRSATLSVEAIEAQ